jgi:hypothetical protein
MFGRSTWCGTLFLSAVTTAVTAAALCIRCGRSDLSCSPIWTQPLGKAISRVDDLNRLRPYIRPWRN